MSKLSEGCLLGSRTLPLCEIEATDPLTFALTALRLIGVAPAACHCPARRTTRVDRLLVVKDE